MPLQTQSQELKIIDIKLKIVRGKTGPVEQRFQYSTLIEYYIGESVEGEDQKILTMGIIPPTYFYLKRVLNEELDDLDKVISHNIQRDSRKIIRELFIDNNLMFLNLKNALSGSIERVVIDNVHTIGKLNYNFSASIYLTNGQRIPYIIPSDALVFALVAGKDIFVTTSLLEEKDRIDREFEEQISAKKRGESESGEQKAIPRNIYT